MQPTNVTPPTPAQQERIEQFSRVLARILRRIKRISVSTTTKPQNGVSQ